MEVLVFGGTAEGRELVAWLDARGTCEVVACATTEYGESLLAGSSRVSTLRGPLSDEEKRTLMERHAFCCVVDATHPYAAHISQSVRSLAAAYSVPLVRVVREGAERGPWVSVPDAAAAARHLAATEGGVLLTTGSKDLATFVSAMPNFAERLYVRVLPVAEALQHTRELGIPTSHVVAMQGPFSQQLNEALIRELGVSCLVTKQSGAQGGFGQKAAAAAACDIELVVIERPVQEEGVSLQGAKALLEEEYGL